MDDDRNDVEVTIDDGDIDSNDDSDKDCSFAFNFTVLIGDDDDDDEVENASQPDPKNRGVVSIVLIEEKHNNRNTTPSNCTAIIVNFSLLSSLFLSSLIYSKPSFTILHLPRCCLLCAALSPFRCTKILFNQKDRRQAIWYFIFTNDIVNE